jgi:hypothetical protein
LNKLTLEKADGTIKNRQYRDTGNAWTHKPQDEDKQSTHSKNKTKQNTVRVMVFNATFNNISVISWRSVLLVEETGLQVENYRPVASH